jgi:hypothetical protein
MFAVFHSEWDIISACTALLVVASFPALLNILSLNILNILSL